MAMLFLTLFVGFGLLYVAVSAAMQHGCFPGCVSSASSPSGSQSGGITDKYIQYLDSLTVLQIVRL